MPVLEPTADAMDLNHTPQAEGFRKELRSWLAANLTHEVLAASRDRSGDDDAAFATLRAWNATLVDAGYGAVSWPAEFGGRDADPVTEMIFNEEMSRAGAPGPVNAIGVANIGPAIMTAGTAAQRQRYLPPMLRGDEIWCQGMSEPDAGSDLASLRTTARRDGDDFVIDGRKVWTSEGHRADWCQLYARTDPDATKHQGLSAFLVDMTTPGIEARRIRTMAGDASFSELFLDEVRVPADALLGELHGGWQVATTTLGFERAGVVKLASMVRNKLDRLITDVAGTGGDDVRVADPVTRDELTRRHIEVECLRLLAARAVSTAQHQGVPGPEGSIAKLAWADTDQALTTTATRALGLSSLTGGWSREACASRSLSIAGGTTEINKNILADRVLGLPRPPKA